MSYEYNPNVFATEKPRNIFLDRIDCWADTQKLAKKYEAPPKSVKFRYDPELKMEKKYSRTPIQISDMDTIECGLLLQKNEYNPLVLNLADHSFAGGCVNTGAHTQEESLFRCTNLCLTLKMLPNLYPIKDDEAVYSKNIRILKTSEQRGWKIINTPIYMDFIACPGIYMPRLDYSNEKYPKLKPEDIEKLIKKIELILQVAYVSGHDSLVLGASGCGAWRNPPKHVAEIFKEVLKENDGLFKRIHFAILKNVDNIHTVNKNREKPVKDNYDVFNEVFTN